MRTTAISLCCLPLLAACGPTPGGGSSSSSTGGTSSSSSSSSTGGGSSSFASSASMGSSSALSSTGGGSSHSGGGSSSAESSGPTSSQPAGTCAAPIQLACGHSYVVDTATGSAALDTYPACDSAGFHYPSAESVYRFDATEATDVTFSVQRTGGLATTWVLFLLDGAGAACGSTLPCLGTADDFSPSRSLTLQPGAAVFLAYDARVTPGASTVVTLDVACDITVCGDGVTGRGETCDDGATSDGDGCSGTCQLESGWACSGAPSTCHAIACGDGHVDAPETCDDGATSAGDGCSATCLVEAGWVCNGMPSSCAQALGDTCADAPAVTAPATLDFANGQFNDDVAAWLGSCRTNFAARDRFWRVTVPAGRVLRAHAVDTVSFPSLRLLLSAACPGAAESCFAEAAASGIRWLNNTAASRDVWLAADSLLAGDTGSVGIAVDFEDPAPYATGQTCLHAMRLSAAETNGTQTVNGDTAASSDFYHGYLGACAAVHFGIPGLGAGPDVTHVVKVPAGKLLTVTSSATWDHVVALADGCQDLQAACLAWSDNGDPSFRNTTASDKDVFIVVDGFQDYAHGAFTLTATLSN